MVKDYQLAVVQVQSFLEDEYLVVRDLFDSEETEMLLRAANSDRLMSDYSMDINDRSSKSSKITVWNHPGNDIWGMVSRSARLVDAMEAMLGGEVYTTIIQNCFSKNQRSEEHGNGIRIMDTGIKTGAFTPI